VVSQRLSFSSYPGELFSDDDLYITDAGLIVTETTNHNFNQSLLDLLNPAAVLSWQRVRIGERAHAARAGACYGLGMQSAAPGSLMTRPPPHPDPALTPPPHPPPLPPPSPAANMAAASGRDWVAVFSEHNSGTYNNQYMVVDTNRFLPK
jgi:hypothetical protein